MDGRRMAATLEISHFKALALIGKERINPMLRSSDHCEGRAQV